MIISSTRRKLESGDIFTDSHGNRIEFGSFGATFSPKYGDVSHLAPEAARQGYSDGASGASGGCSTAAAEAGKNGKPSPAAGSYRTRSESRESEDSDQSERSLADLSQFDESDFDGDITERTDISLASLSARGMVRGVKKKKRRKKKRAGGDEDSPRGGEREEVPDTLADQYKNFIHNKMDPRFKDKMTVLTEGGGPEEGSEELGAGQVEAAAAEKTAYVSLTMPGTREAGHVLDEEGRPIDEKFIEFEVRVKVSGYAAWSQWHSFETFRELHSNLMERVDLAAGAPEFPPPYGLHEWLGKGMEDEFVTVRRLELQGYLQILLAEDSVLTNTLMRSFLGMNQAEHFIEPERKVKYLQDRQSEKPKPLKGFSTMPCIAREPSCTVM